MEKYTDQEIQEIKDAVASYTPRIQAAIIDAGHIIIKLSSLRTDHYESVKTQLLQLIDDLPGTAKGNLASQVWESFDRSFQEFEPERRKAFADIAKQIIRDNPDYFAKQIVAYEKDRQADVDGLPK